MKANFILGKKQIILASLVLVLGVAVYLNWSFAKNGEEFEPMNAETTNETKGIVEETIGLTDEETPVVADEGDTDAVADKSVDADVVKQDDASNVKHLGEAQLVSAKMIVDENYFVKAKLARTRARDEAIATISTILEDEKLTEADKKLATEKAISITDIIEAESKIENLVKAKGYEECMVYISENSATVVVKTSGLDQAGATQIKNIVVNEGLVKGENVSITEIN